MQIQFASQPYLEALLNQCQQEARPNPLFHEVFVVYRYISSQFEFIVSCVVSWLGLVNDIVEERL